MLVLANLPLPVRQGIDLRAWTLIDALTQLGPVAVFGLRCDELAPPPQPGIAAWTSSRDRALTARGPEALLGWMRRSDGSPGDAYYSDRAGSELAALAASFDPDVVVIEELRLHRYLDHVDRAHRAVVIDTPALASELARQQAEVEVSKGAAILARSVASRYADLEAQLLPGVDQVWACSAVDAAKLASRHPSAAIEIVPNTVAVDRYPDASHRPDTLRVVFPATFAFLPNELAAMMLIEEVMPRVREREPSAELVLVGSHTGSRLAGAIDGPGLVHQGAVPDIRPHLGASSVMAVPLTIASGTRYKLLEAFASRLPVVATALAAEGLEVDDGVHLILGEDPASIATAILRTWSDATVRTALTTAAHELVCRRYSFETSRRAVAAATSKLR